MCCAISFSLNAVAAEEEESRYRNDPLDQGGEACANATPINSLPFCDTGTTVGYVDNYASTCAPGLHAPDVVYTMFVASTRTVTFSLCGSSYNTALTVWRHCPSSGGTLVCCSNDICGDDACCAVTLTPGAPYYIVVDGGSTADMSGDYLFNVLDGADVCPNTPCPPTICTYDSIDTEPNNSCLDPSGIASCGDTLCGFMEPNSNDFHYFVVGGNGWSNVTIDVFGNDTPGFYPFNNGLNPRVEIQSCSQVYAADSDGGVGNDARIENYCLAAGVYLLHVSAEPQSNSGPYLVAISCEPCTTACTYSNLDYEPANSDCNNPMVAIECGDTLCGALIALDTLDYYRLDITGAGLHTLTIDIFGNDTPGYFPFGQGLDPKITLLATPCFNSIAVDFDGGVGEDARLIADSLTAGTYYLVVESAFNTPGGPYVMAIDCRDATCNYPNLDIEPNGTCNGGGGGTIILGDTVCGNQELGSNDYYFFDVPGPTCKLVSIDAFGDDTPGFYPFGLGMNSALTLYALTPGCAPLASDQNSGIGEDARLDSICLEPGRYRLLVTAEPQGVSSGPYVVATSYTLCACATCDYPNGDIEANNNSCANYGGGSITCGDTVCGLITADTGPDHLNFTVLGFECKLVTIDAFGDDTPGFYPFGQGLNSHLILYDDTTCVPIIQDDNDGVGSDARVQVCLDPGTYRLRVSNGTSGTTGPWIIATSCSPCVLPPCPEPDSVVIVYPAQNGFGNPFQDIELQWPPVPGAIDYQIYGTDDNNDPLIVTPANFLGSATGTHFVHENIVSLSDAVWIYQVVTVCSDGDPCAPAPPAARKPEMNPVSPPLTR